MNRAAFLLLLPGLLLGPDAPLRAARPSAEALLRRSYQAERRYSYSGRQEVTLYAWGEPVRFQAMLYHQRPNRTKLEYVKQDESGANGRPWDRRGAQSLVQRVGGRRLPAEDRLTLLLSNYNLRTGGTDEVAGRSAVIITISPRRPGNPSQTLWIDRQTGIVLRSQLRNSSGILVSDAAFQQLNLTPSLENVTFPGSQSPPKPPPDFPLLFPTYVPPGYQYVGADGLEVRGQLVAHLKYTDGLNTISLFQHPGRERPRNAERPARRDRASRDPRGSPARRDPRQSPIQVLRRRVRDRSITLIGDMDPGELSRMADSLR